MHQLEKLDTEYVRSKLPEFQQKTIDFYNGDLSMKDYKGFSGKYGSYAQRGKKASMLRLRMPAGRLTKKKLKFILDQADLHNIDLIHFTTCQAVQLHNLQPEALFDTMDKALDADIVCYGGGGDYPRNVMCSPLSGVEKRENFDVLPYAQAMGTFLMHFIDAEKMPRKLKVAFSNSPENVPHATFRDLGFVANENGTFDVYAAGGLGVNPKFGVRVAENVPKEDILYYAKAMIETFKKYGNYENRTKARTRFMVDALGGEEAFRKAFEEELSKIKENEDLKLENVEEIVFDKKPDGVIGTSYRILPQKQEGLYTLRYHPLGGTPDLKVLHSLYNAIEAMEQVEIRLAPDETAYIINLTAREAEKLESLIDSDAAKNPFESSIGCIGASICQVGVRDSQELLKDVIKAVKEAEITDDALPQIHISGCPSSCGTHQVGSIGFRGGVKLIDKKPVPGFTLFVNGNDLQGQEKMGAELGAIAIERIPEFLVKLGRTVEQSNMNYEQWSKANPNGIAEVAAEFIA